MCYMKSMSFEELAQIEGGGFWAGFCAAASIVTMVAPWLQLTPIGGQILIATDIGCGIWAFVAAARN